LWIRLELTMRLKKGWVFPNSELSVCFAAHYQSFALEKCVIGCPLSSVSIARDTRIRWFLESEGGQVALTWQSKTIQSP
jgi:hypothetical protein